MDPVEPLTLCELLDTGDRELETFSPFCLKVRRALRFAGLPFTSRRRATPGGHRDVNPLGQVPVLLVGDEAVVDSTAILARITAWRASRLRPSGRVARAESLLFEELADSSLHGFVVAARWADERNWPGVQRAFFGEAPPPVRWWVIPRARDEVLRSLVQRDVWRAGPDACWSRFQALLDQLEDRAPSGDGFWVGEGPSGADFAMFGQLHSLRHDLTPWQRARLAERPALSAYLDRIQELTRPARPLREAAWEGPRGGPRRPRPPRRTSDADRPGRLLVRQPTSRSCAGGGTSPSASAGVSTGGGRSLVKLGTWSSWSSQ
ncbi:MAG: glutathione S-transferase family protein [Sandaracinaceae bacterium]